MRFNWPMRLGHSGWCVLLLALAVCQRGLVHGAEATHELPSLDDDFAIQGEYAGFVQSRPGADTAWTGFQIVALGGGRLEAVEFPGGLPGNGGNRHNARRYVGHRSLVDSRLRSADRELILSADKGLVHDRSGSVLGRILKMQRTSRTLGAKPPQGATILLDDQGAHGFSNPHLTADRLLGAGTQTRREYGDFSMHLEFRTPYMPMAQGQARGNSGVYIQGRYEVQILDSFGLEGANNECGALYKARPPLLNMCFPPMTWQTYDIDFIAARFDQSGNKASPARVTVRHNGIVVQKDAPLAGPTGAGSAEGPQPRPIKLQDHGNAVQYRNIWVVERTVWNRCVD
ncbi:MAG: DUF1080 domain-containing protein [Planctomycetales bacterium]